MKVVVTVLNDKTTVITPVESTIDQIKGTLTGAYCVIDSTDLPDGLFRESWVLKKNKVVCDLTKAKDIWKDKWRKARVPILRQLDLEFMKAVEQADSDMIRTIGVKKQQLRDITNTSLSKARNIDTLKQIWPDILGPNPYIK